MNTCAHTHAHTHIHTHTHTHTNFSSDIAILGRPKGGPHERLQEGEGSSSPEGSENVVFPSEIHQFHSKVLIFLKKINKMEELGVPRGGR